MPLYPRRTREIALIHRLYLSGITEINRLRSSAFALLMMHALLMMLRHHVTTML